MKRYKALCAQQRTIQSIEACLELTEKMEINKSRDLKMSDLNRHASKNSTIRNRRHKIYMQPKGGKL